MGYIKSIIALLLNVLSAPSTLLYGMGWTNGYILYWQVIYCLSRQCDFNELFQAVLLSQREPSLNAIHASSTDEVFTIYRNWQLHTLRAGWVQPSHAYTNYNQLARTVASYEIQRKN